MKYLTLDIETKDLYIERGLDAGWVYKVNVPNSDYEVLGVAYRLHDGTAGYTLDKKFLQEQIDEHDYIIAHNASYDLGGLISLGIKVKDKPLIDTEVMSRIFNSSLQTHGLSFLAIKYLRARKNNQELIDSVRALDLVPYTSMETRKLAKDPEFKREVNDKKCLDYAKKNLDILQKLDYNVVSKYAIQDAEVTYRLFDYFKRAGIDMALVEKYSFITHICLQYRLQGVRIDLERAENIKETLTPVVDKLLLDVYSLAGKEFNINSTQQIAEVFNTLNIAYNTKEETGNPTIDKSWMAEQPYPICQAINKYRQVNKIYKDFICHIIDMQEFTGCKGKKYGRVYPSLNLMRANTGRFSCSSPNIQQIPRPEKKEKGYGYTCRSLFIPEEGEKWFSIDFASQEIRIQIHYAHLLKCEGADLFVQEFKANKKFDLHEKVAQLANISRDDAKALNLGISYGMGIVKIAKSLKTSVEEAKEIRKQYAEMCPYLVELDKKAKQTLKERGSIRTILGRPIALDPPTVDEEARNGLRSYEYKALNKLIQGSAVDQTIEAMLQAYKEGIHVLFPVHDELCMSGTKEQAIRLKEIMEGAVKLEIPVVADLNVEGGSNWADAK